MLPSGLEGALKYTTDVTIADLLARAVAENRTEHFPFRELVQKGMVLRDGFLENMADAQWRKSLRPRVEGSRYIAPDRQHCISAVSSGACSRRGFSGESGNMTIDHGADENRHLDTWANGQRFAQLAHLANHSKNYSCTTTYGSGRVNSAHP